MFILQTPIPIPTPTPGQPLDQINKTVERVTNSLDLATQQGAIGVLLLVGVTGVFIAVWLVLRTYINRNKGDAVDRMTRAFTDLIEQFKAEAKSAQLQAQEARTAADNAQTTYQDEIKVARQENTENAVHFADAINRIADIADAIKDNLKATNENGEAAAIKLSNIQSAIEPIKAISERTETIVKRSAEIVELLKQIKELQDAHQKAQTEHSELIEQLRQTVQDLTLSKLALDGAASAVQSEMKKRDTQPVQAIPENPT